LVGAWLVAPPSFLLVYSLAVSSVYLDRYLVISLPALLLAVAFGICRIERPWTWVSLSVVVVLCTVEIVDWYRSPSFQDWRGATHHVLAHAQPGDGVVFCGKQQPFEYYAIRSDRRDVPVPVVPADPWVVGFHTFTARAVPIAEWPDRVWVVDSTATKGDNRSACFGDDLGGRDRESEARFSGPIDVELWTRV
jgi:mannosyltransferase